MAKLSTLDAQPDEVGRHDSELKHERIQLSISHLTTIKHAALIRLWMMQFNYQRRVTESAPYQYAGGNTGHHHHVFRKFVALEDPRPSAKDDWCMRHLPTNNSSSISPSSLELNHIKSKDDARSNLDAGRIEHRPLVGGKTSNLKFSSMAPQMRWHTDVSGTQLTEVASGKDNLKFTRVSALKLHSCHASGNTDQGTQTGTNKLSIFTDV